MKTLLGDCFVSSIASTVLPEAFICLLFTSQYLPSLPHCAYDIKMSGKLSCLSVFVDVLLMPSFAFHFIYSIKTPLGSIMWIFFQKFHHFYIIFFSPSSVLQLIMNTPGFIHQNSPPYQRIQSFRIPNYISISVWFCILFFYNILKVCLYLKFIDLDVHFLTCKIVSRKYVT